MENVTDALKIAAFVLLFVLALSISINAFGEVRQTSQIILDNSDREYEYTYVQESGTTTRIVGVETIIPSIYKSYKENYKIIFESSRIDANGGLYRKKNSDGTDININYIDLEKEVLGNDTQKMRFIMAVLYGPNNTNDDKEYFKKNLGINLNDDGLYDKIKDIKFKEELGIYYQEEVTGESNSPDANKTQKRVITYTDMRDINE